MILTCASNAMIAKVLCFGKEGPSMALFTNRYPSILTSCIFTTGGPGLVRKYKANEIQGMHQHAQHHHALALIANNGIHHRQEGRGGGDCF